MELVDRLILEKEKENKLSERRKSKYATNYRTIEAIAGEPILPILKDKKKLRILIDKIDNSKYAAWTKADFRLLVKMLWKVVNHFDFKDQPKAVRYIRVGIRRNERKRNWQLLTDDEVTTMMKATKSARDKAIISILYELGPRVSEIVAMRKNNVSFHEQGCRLTIPATKTDERTLLVINSVPYLAGWMAAHPSKKEDAPLFVAEYHGEIKQMRPETVLKMLRVTARKAGIKRRVYCHLFRHTALTNLAKTLSEQQLKVAAGWDEGSQQAATYVHLSGKDLDSALLRARGKPVKSEDIANKLAPIICKRCGKQNAHDAKACQYCLFIFDAEALRRSEAGLQDRLKRLETLERTVMRLAAEKAKK